MALIPKISVCTKDNCKQFPITDITGLYSITNTGGWGSPNLELDGVTEATILVTIPDNNALEIDVTSEVTGAIIVDGIFELTILTMEDNFDGDKDTVFPDGIYELTYTIVGGGETYTYSIKTFSTCNSACCLEKMKVKFEEKMCTGCNWEDYWKNYNIAKFLLNGAKRAFACGDTTKAENLLDQVNKICKNTNCNC